MKCIWFLIFVLVRGSLGDFNNRIVQTITDFTNDVRVTDQCSDALALYLQNLLNSTDDQWALKMLDATSKIPVGLLFTYNFGELGEFDQCLDTESNDGLIKARYCLGFLPVDLANVQGRDLEVFKRQLYTKEISRVIGGIKLRDAETGFMNIGPSWAICLPSACTNLDVIEILNTLIGSQTALCQTKDDLSPPLTTGAIATLVILAFFGFLLVASTVCDLFHIYRKTDPHWKILVAFSVHKNGRKLFKISKNSTELSCLNGIRFLSMVWVIIGHVYVTAVSSAPDSNYIAILNFSEALYSMTIISGSLSVDTFLFISGLLVVYGFMKAKHNGVKFNIFKFYIHRYLRLTPALAVVVLITATLLNYMGSGPVWKYTELTLQEPCQTYWWTTLLYLQNYINEDLHTCVAQTWYLSVDMQLYVLSPLILIPLWRFPRIGMSLIGACILAFIITPFFIAYDNELPGLLSNMNDRDGLMDYMTVYYMKTHTRVAPWLIGALLGYILSVIKFQAPETWFRKFKGQQIIATLVWAACIAILLTCVYGGHSTLRGTEYDKWGNAFYIALVRPTWALSLAWVVFACVVGYGGPINWILSLPIYQVLNRFTYSIYLLHLSILYMIAFAARRGAYFTDFNMAYSFWGITMFSFGLSIIWVLAFESPVIVIEKLIFSWDEKSMKNGGQKRRDGLES